MINPKEIKLVRPSVQTATEHLAPRPDATVKILPPPPPSGLEKYRRALPEDKLTPTRS
jgi:hypothetical protein